MSFYRDGEICFTAAEVEARERAAEREIERARYEAARWKEVAENKWSIDDLAEAKLEGFEEAMELVRHIPACPFDGPTQIKPEEPCPICGDLGTINDDPPHCQSAFGVLRAELARRRSEG